MEYRQIPPPLELSAWVECIWTLRGALAPEGQMILPDGRRELVFHFGARPWCGGVVQPDCLIAGTGSAAVDISAGGVMEVIGVRLRPGAGGLVPPDSTSLPYLAMDSGLGPWAKRTYERLGNATGEASRIAMLWEALRGLLLNCEEPDRAVAASVGIIERRLGQGPTETFLPAGLGERQWQRRFSRACGYSPKTFARITRFQHLVGRYKAGEDRSWAEIALEAGFYDQAHLVNEFRAFCGVSPEAYFRSGRGMAEFYSSR